MIGAKQHTLRSFRLQMTQRQEAEVDALERQGWTLAYFNAKDDAVMTRELGGRLDGFNMTTVIR